MFTYSIPTEETMSPRLKVWFLLVGLVTLVLLLGGGWTDPWAWAYCATCLATITYGMLGADEDLMRERFTPPSKGADAEALRFVRLLALAHLVVGAMDGGRWHMIAPVPALVRAAALAGMAMSFILVFRSMHENHYFSAVVRVQEERGHRVVDTGPYSVIRHPGYAGMIAGVPLSGLALGSWIGFSLALLYSALIMRRVLFEDAFLQRNLRGYVDYTQRVTGRLIPGRW
jgi:protein-S-isoprenylcysteine O-methyltransferase Ste14